MAAVPLDDAAALLAALSDFFHVAVHAVLFYRRLYPARSFLSATAFGVPVHQSRHPQVCAWVADAVDHVMGQLAGGAVETVAVVVHAPLGGDAAETQGLQLPPGAILERWVFDVSHLPAWPGGADDLHQALHPGRPLSARPPRKTRLPLDSLPDDDSIPWDRTDDDDDDGGEDENNNDDNEDDNDDDAESEADLDGNTPQSQPSTSSASSADLHHQLRAAILRLAQAATAMDPLPPRCSFTVALEVGDAAELRQPRRPSAKRSTAWVPEETAGAKRKRATATTTTTTTIRTVDAAPLFMECWVEESVLKKKTATPPLGLSFPVLPPPPRKGPAGKTVSFDA